MTRSCAALLLFACAAGAQSVRVLDRETIEARFSRLHAKNEERAAELRRTFAEAGCAGSNYAEKAVRGSKLPNLICVLPGSTPRTIIVSAHFDNKGPGEGAIDNWSGAVLLPSLYESLRAASPRFTFQFIGFTDEERGLFGSRDYVAQLGKDDKAAIAADVNIDSLGFPGPIRVWATRAHPDLMNASALVADSMKLRIGGNSLDRMGESDSRAFYDWKIPVIDFHSITSDTLPVLHSKRDVRGALDLQSYYDSYRFLVAYLARLDADFPIKK